MLAEKEAVSMPDTETAGYTTCSRASSNLLGQYPFPFELPDDALVDELLRL